MLSFLTEICSKILMISNSAAKILKNTIDINWVAMFIVQIGFPS